MNPEPFLSLLMWLLAVLYVLSAVCWGVCAWWFREERPAILHWSLGLFLAGVGFMLIATRGEPRTWLAYVWGNLCFVAGYVVFARGVERFAGLRTADRTHAALFGLAVAVMVLAGPGREHASWRVLATFGVALPVIGGTFVRAARPALAEVGWRVMALVFAPVLVVLTVFAARVMEQAFDPLRPIEIQLSTVANRNLLLAFFVVLILFNFVCTFLVASRLIRRMSALVRQDALTRMPNRVALQEFLEREWAQTRRGGTAFALLALDLDRFKRINDAHGHLPGDHVLEEAARRFMAVARRADLVARTGGDEFLMVIPGASWDGALIVAERMRETIAREPFRLQDQAQVVTVSIGVTLSHPDDEELDVVLRRADQALYRAKADGRDRVAKLERGGADWALVA